MRHFLRWISIIAAIVCAVSLAYFLYATFLLDYNLVDLELALSVVKKGDAENDSPLIHNVYRNIVQDLALQEVAKEQVDYKNLMMLEVASRSLTEVVERGGYAHARFLLHQVASSKFPARNKFLKIGDAIYGQIAKTYQALFSFSAHLQKRILPKLPEIREPFEYSSLLMLSQAYEKERAWQFDEAAHLYRKYLKNYPTKPDRAYAAIALAQVLIRQQKMGEAEKLLQEVQIAYGTTKEGEIAARLSKKIDFFKNRQLLIQKLLQLIPVHEGTPLGESLQLKLALAYLLTYRFSEAQDHLKKLEKSQEAAIRQKAKFYRGWIFKLNAQYDEGIEILLDLLDEPKLERELGLGLIAEVADIYYQKKDPVKALRFYKRLSQEAEDDSLARKASVAAWIGLGELEQANINLFDLNDPAAAAANFNRLEEFFPGSRLLGDLTRELEEASRVNLRERAFRALKQRKVHLAFDLFQRNLIRQPKDAWTHSGLATCYVLFANLRDAAEYAVSGYDLGVDEYTAAVLGYVEGFLQRYEDSIGHYQESLGRDPKYIPARYNLACMFLKTNKHQMAYEMLILLENDFQNVRNVMHSKILNNLGCALWWLGSREQAVERFRASLVVTPGFLDAKKNLALVDVGRAPQITTLLE